MRVVRGLIAGSPPLVPVWHPAWLDYRLVTKLLMRHRHSIEAGRACHVSFGQDLLGSAFAPNSRFRVEHLASDSLPFPSDASCSLILVEVSADRITELRSIIDGVRPFAAQGREIAVFVKDPGPRSGYLDLGPPLISQIEMVAPRNLHGLKVRYAGGALKLSLYLWSAWWIGWYRRYGAIALPAVAAGLAITGLLVSLNNLLQHMLHDPRYTVSPCTSFLIAIDAGD